MFDHVYIERAKIDANCLEEVTLAMEEILENEKDFKQLVDVTNFLFERSQELSSKMEDQSGEMQQFMIEQSRMEDQEQQS